jgi:tetratricopeptide (TPR) repeat protein
LSLLHLEKFSDCIDICNKVLQENEFDNYALTLKIHALENLGKFNEVLNCCEKLLAKNKGDTWALNSKGLALNELNKYKEASEIFDKVLEIDIKNITALINKASSMSILGNHKQSIEFYDLAQKINPLMKELSEAKSREFEKLELKDEAFLAAQGILLEDIEKIKQDSIKNKCSVFHQFCQNEYEKTKNKSHKIK